MIRTREPEQHNREGIMKHHHRLTILLLACAVASAAAGLQAKELYRWTDENGVVHFSDRKPTDVRDFETTQLPDAAPAPVAEASDTAAEPAAEEPTAEEPAAEEPAAEEPGAEEPASVAQQRREEIARRALEARQTQAERDAECAAWRDELARIEPSRRVYYTNEAGETERMDDVARVGRVAELKQAIAGNCR